MSLYLHYCECADLPAAAPQVAETANECLDQRHALCPLCAVRGEYLVRSAVAYRFVSGSTLQCRRSAGPNGCGRQPTTGGNRSESALDFAPGSVRYRLWGCGAVSRDLYGVNARRKPPAMGRVRDQRSVDCAPRGWHAADGQSERAGRRFSRRGRARSR
jgi:hypothetical protein